MKNSEQLASFLLARLYQAAASPLSTQRNRWSSISMPEPKTSFKRITTLSADLAAHGRTLALQNFGLTDSVRLSEGSTATATSKKASASCVLEALGTSSFCPY